MTKVMHKPPREIHRPPLGADGSAWNLLQSLPEDLPPLMPMIQQLLETLDDGGPE